jgi:hypothetical protein
MFLSTRLSCQRVISSAIDLETEGESGFVLGREDPGLGCFLCNLVEIQA